MRGQHVIDVLEHPGAWAKSLKRRRSALLERLLSAANRLALAMVGLVIATALASGGVTNMIAGYSGGGGGGLRMAIGLGSFALGVSCVAWAAVTFGRSMQRLVEHAHVGQTPALSLAQRAAMAAAGLPEAEQRAMDVKMDARTRTMDERTRDKE